MGLRLVGGQHPDRRRGREGLPQLGPGRVVHVHQFVESAHPRMIAATGRATDDGLPAAVVAPAAPARAEAARAGQLDGAAAPFAAWLSP
ncbi:hypothetical protein GCM10010195_05660 [Kitasatospora griseola]|nr:hypothetical protein GCM10010195_05660 [Kitasatospora griseola]